MEYSTTLYVKRDIGLSPSVRKYLAYAIVLVPAILLIIGITYCCIAQRRKHHPPPHARACCGSAKCSFCGGSMQATARYTDRDGDGQREKEYQTTSGPACWRSNWYVCHACASKGRNYKRYAAWRKRVQNGEKATRQDKECGWEEIGKMDEVYEG